MIRFALDARRLSVKYRTSRGTSVLAVDQLSFAVNPGEVVGFLGPNGAGKSSTLKALMGFVAPCGGECKVFGLQAGSLEAKKKIGYLPEVALYYPYLTPQETLTLYGELQGLRGKALRQQVEGLIQQLGISAIARKQNRSISKGQLQRVGIAQSLLGTPELLVLDEVTSGLDPIGRKELRQLLLGKRNEGCTLFFSSHELSEVEMLCDRILIINKGRLIEERRMSDLKMELQRFGLTYLDANTGLQVQEDYKSKAELLEGIQKVNGKNGKVMDVVSQEGSLEDYFVNTIGRAA